MATAKQVDGVFRYLCAHGLRVRPEDLTSRERKRQKEILAEILEDREPQEVMDVIQYGMPNVWPFSTDGRVWDARDLDNNFTKALGEAGKRKRRGSIPFNAQRVRPPDGD